MQSTPPKPPFHVLGATSKPITNSSPLPDHTTRTQPLAHLCSNIAKPTPDTHLSNSRASQINNEGHLQIVITKIPRTKQQRCRTPLPAKSQPLNSEPKTLASTPHVRTLSYSSTIKNPTHRSESPQRALSRSKDGFSQHDILKQSIAYHTPSSTLPPPPPIVPPSQQGLPKKERLPLPTVSISLNASLLHPLPLTPQTHLLPSNPSPPALHTQPLSKSLQNHHINPKPSQSPPPPPLPPSQPLQTPLLLQYISQSPPTPSSSLSLRLAPTAHVFMKSQNKRISIPTLTEPRKDLLQWLESNLWGLFRERRCAIFNTGSG